MQRYGLIPLLGDTTGSDGSTSYTWTGLQFNNSSIETTIWHAGGDQVAKNGRRFPNIEPGCSLKWIYHVGGWNKGSAGTPLLFTEMEEFRGPFGEEQGGILNAAITNMLDMHAALNMSSFFSSNVYSAAPTEPIDFNATYRVRLNGTHATTAFTSVFVGVLVGY